MKQLIAVVVVLFLILLALPSGPPTHPAEPQLLEQATRHAEQQAAQLEHQAVQNERLVALQQQWQAERAELYQQRDDLESARRDLAVERRELAMEQQREPIVAQSILQLGTLVLGLLPLSVCLLLLRRSQDPTESDAVAETLVDDLMSASPLVCTRELPSPAPTVGRLGSAGNDSSLPLEPPSP